MLHNTGLYMMMGGGYIEIIPYRAITLWVREPLPSSLRVNCKDYLKLMGLVIVESTLLLSLHTITVVM